MRRYLRYFVALAGLSLLAGCMAGAGPKTETLLIGRMVIYDFPDHLSAAETAGWARQRQHWRADGTYTFWRRPLLNQSKVFATQGRWFMKGNQYCEGSPGDDDPNCYRLTALSERALAKRDKDRLDKDRRDKDRLAKGPEDSSTEPDGVSAKGGGIRLELIRAPSFLGLDFRRKEWIGRYGDG